MYQKETLVLDYDNPQTIQLVFDGAKRGENARGPWAMYTVRTGGREAAFFATPELDQAITKLAPRADDYIAWRWQPPTAGAANGHWQVSRVNAEGQPVEHTTSSPASRAHEKKETSGQDYGIKELRKPNMRAQLEADLAALTTDWATMLAEVKTLYAACMQAATLCWLDSKASFASRDVSSVATTLFIEMNRAGAIKKPRAQPALDESKILAAAFGDPRPRNYHELAAALTAITNNHRSAWRSMADVWYHLKSDLEDIGCQTPSDLEHCKDQEVLAHLLAIVKNETEKRNKALAQI